MILLASAFKSVGSPTIVYFGSTFFNLVYTGYNKTKYSLIYALIPIFSGIPSILIGGFLGDYFESVKGGKRLYMKGYISGIGALLASFFVVTCFLIQINYWISISSFFFITLFAEVWHGNTIAMINKIVP